MRFHRGGPGGPFGKHEAAAKYLGLSQDDLHEKLEGGKSLADVAKERNKSVDGLKDAMLAEAKKNLDEAVDDKKLTRSQADQIFDRMKSHIDDRINGKPHTMRFRGGPGGPGGHGGPGGPGFGPPPGMGGPWGDDERGRGDGDGDNGDTLVPAPPPDSLSS
jgi:hypothetical protein